MPSAFAAEVNPRCSATAWKVRSDVKLIAISNSSHGIFEFGNGPPPDTLSQKGRSGRMWRYSNPVAITFGVDAFAELPKLIGGQPYALVTYPDAPFAALAERLRAAAGEPAVTVERRCAQSRYEASRRPERALQRRRRTEGDRRARRRLGHRHREGACRGARWLCACAALSPDRRRRGSAVGDADHRSADHGRHRQRSHVLGDRVGHPVGKEVLAVAARASIPSTRWSIPR